MSSSLEATPAQAPFPVPDYLGLAKLSPMDLYNLCQDATQEPCRIPVNVGLFFDGTNNHMERDRDGKRGHVPLNIRGTGSSFVEIGEPMKSQKSKKSGLLEDFWAQYQQGKTV